MITKLSENAIQRLLEKKEDTSIVQLLSEPKPFLNQESLMQIEISDGYFYYKKVFIIGNAIPKHNKLKKFMILKVNLNKQQQKQDMIIIDDFSIIYQNLDKLIGAPINFKKFQEGIKNPQGSREIPMQYLNNNNDTQKTEQVKLLNPKTLFSESDSSQEKHFQQDSKLVNQQNDQHENGDKQQNKIFQQNSQDSQGKFNYLGEDQDFLFSFDAFINKAKYFRQTNQITYNKSSLSNKLNQQISNKSLEKEPSLIKNQGLSYLQKKKKEIQSTDKVGSSFKKVQNVQLSAQSTSNNQTKQVIAQNDRDQIFKNKDTPQSNNISFVKEQNNINEKPVQKQQDIPSKAQPVSKEINNIIQQNQVEGNNDPKHSLDQEIVINQQQNQQLKQNTNEQQSEAAKQNTSAFNILKIKLQQLSQKRQRNKEDVPIESYLSSSSNQKTNNDQYFSMKSSQNHQSAQILKDQVQLSGEKYNRVEQKSEQIRKLFISKTSNKLLQKFKSPSPQKNGQGHENQQNSNMDQFCLKKSIPIKKFQKSNQLESSSNIMVESSNEDEVIKNTKNFNIKDAIQFSQSQTNQKQINNDKQQIIINSSQNKIPSHVNKSDQEIFKVSNVPINQSVIKEKIEDQQQQQSAEKKQTNNNQQISKINQISNFQNQNNQEIENFKKSTFNQFSPIQMKKSQNNIVDNDADFLFSQSDSSQSQEFVGFIKASDFKQSADNQQASERNQNKSQQLQEIIKIQPSSKNNSLKKEDSQSQQSKKINKILEKEQNNLERDWKYLIQAIEDSSQSGDEITKQIQENQVIKQKQNFENTPSKIQEESSISIATQNINKRFLKEAEDIQVQNQQQTTQYKENILKEDKQEINYQGICIQNDTSQCDENENYNSQILLDIQQYLISQKTKSQEEKQIKKDSDNKLQEETIKQSQQQEENQQLNSFQEKNEQDNLNKLQKFESIIQTQNKDTNEQSQILIESQQIAQNQDQNNENIFKKSINNIFSVQTQENITQIDQQIDFNKQPQDQDNKQSQPNEQLNISDIEQQQNLNNIQIQSQKSIEIYQINANNKQNDNSMDLEEEGQFDFNIDIENSQKDSNNIQKILDYQSSLEQNNERNSKVQQNDQTLQKQNSNDDLMENEDELNTDDQEQPKIEEYEDLQNEDQQAKKITLSKEQISKVNDLEQPKLDEQTFIKNNEQKSEKINYQLSLEHYSKKSQNYQYNSLTKSDEKEKQKTLFDFNFRKDQQISQQYLDNMEQNQKQSNQKQASANLSKQTIIKKQFKIPSQKKLDTLTLNQSSQQSQFLEDNPQKDQNDQNKQNFSNETKQKEDNIKKSSQKTPIMIELSDDEEIFQFNSKNKINSTGQNMNSKDKQTDNKQYKQILSETKADNSSTDKQKKSVQKQSSIQSNESQDKKSQSNSQSDSQTRKRRRLLKQDFEDIIIKQLHKDQNNETILQFSSIDSSQKMKSSQHLPNSQLENEYCFMKQFEFSNKNKNSQNLQNRKNSNNLQNEKTKVEKYNNNEDWECYSDVSLNEEFIEITDD
ncbi:hypothetical protein ABPG72_007363 [Tetrahymena utriculariae]